MTSSRQTYSHQSLIVSGSLTPGKLWHLANVCVELETSIPLGTVTFVNGDRLAVFYTTARCLHLVNHKNLYKIQMYHHSGQVGLHFSTVSSFVGTVIWFKKTFTVKFLKSYPLTQSAFKVFVKSSPLTTRFVKIFLDLQKVDHTIRKHH